MCVFLFDVLNGCSLVNKYIGKRMSKLCFLETLTLLKRGAKVNFSGKKTWKYTLVLKCKNVQCIFSETFFLALFSSAVLCEKLYDVDLFWFALPGR